MLNVYIQSNLVLAEVGMGYGKICYHDMVIAYHASQIKSLNLLIL